MRLLVTGGLGFIGSEVVRQALSRGHSVVNLDAHTYAANPANLASVAHHDALTQVRGDVCDGSLLQRLFAEHRFDAVMHLAAESHVDRSIDGPEVFVRTNVTGTTRLLEAARRAWSATQRPVRFLHVSTDEVYGPQEPGIAADESHPLNPSSPYASSKAASDLMVQAWHRTYGLPTLVTRCTNNLGPFQSPEKLVPRAIVSALMGSTLPVYGDGLQVRDWMEVSDHVRGLFAVLERGRVGEVYNLGAHAACTNLDLLSLLRELLDEIADTDLCTKVVPDRPGHDRRYAIVSEKARCELGWTPSSDLRAMLRRTVQWFVDHPSWWQAWVAAHPIEARLGSGG